MATNYDKIAGIYDLISRAVYGKALIKAQTCLLNYIPANSNVLIVGGGTGWILEAIAKVHSTGLAIDYVESSAKMIALSKQKNNGANKINFINIAAENYTPEIKYDVILTPFFFDNFKEQKINTIFNNLNEQLKNNGVWLYADFIYDKNKSPLWQQLLLKTMYLFFRITTNIETQELINMDPFFDKDYTNISEIKHYHNFIRSVVYQKKYI